MTDTTDPRPPATFDGLDHPRRRACSTSTRATAPSSFSRPAPDGLEDPGPLQRGFAGAVDLAEDPLRLDVEVTIDAGQHRHRRRRARRHLRSADFFDVEQFPEITFRSTGSPTTTATGSASTATSRSAASPARSCFDATSTASAPPRGAPQAVGFSAAPRSTARTSASPGTRRSRPAACSSARSSRSRSRPRSTAAARPCSRRRTGRPTAGPPARGTAAAPGLWTSEGKSTAMSTAIHSVVPLPFHRPGSVGCARRRGGRSATRPGIGGVGLGPTRVRATSLGVGLARFRERPLTWESALRTTVDSHVITLV